MSRIHILDDRLISQIAAGEVVERPASVLKETLENALDAGANRVEIELSAGGRERLVVRDNGSGMAGDDALLAFDRHATSKIATFDDLEQVATLGFRGEALSSIASVAKVELLTAERAGEGYRVRIEGGRVVVAEPAAAPRGTTIEVAELFWNVPARRKFLKTPPTELRRCLEVVSGYALSRPEVGLRVLHEGRELLRTEATGEGSAGRLERIAQLFGAELAAHLVALPPSSEVAGWVGDRATIRGRRLFVFVNRRLVRDRAILAVFYRAVRDEWQSDRFPALFLFLDLPPEEVDVNVHPQKSEVRFRDPGLLGRVTRALRGGLRLARGEEPAPLREAGGVAPGRLRWEGLGGPSLLADPWTPSGVSPEDDDPLIREPRGAPKLAEVAYTSAPPSTVPLSRGGSGSMRLLGQYKGALILVEAADSLLLIDQHAAHERVLYERFRRHLLERSRHSQKLLVPVLLELAPAEAATLEALAERLEAHGFDLAVLSGSTIAVRAIPSPLLMADAERLLMTLAGTGTGGEDGDSETDSGAAEAMITSRLLDSLAAGQACRSAVKIHRALAPEEIERLISELFDAEQPYACPHGRPTILEMPDSELERRFGRR